MSKKKVICKECGESYPEGWTHTCSESTETHCDVASEVKVEIWPMATEDERENGWIVSYDFLCSVLEVATTNGANVSQEDIEAVLLAVQLHVVDKLKSI